MPEFFHGWAGQSVELACDLLVFKLKIVDASSVGELAFSELGYWLTRPIVRKLLER